jgi:SAM-dependent methyltransferase
VPEPRDIVDVFSGGARQYASARPTYPDTLYEFVSGLAPDRSRAWDCATGNGQAAIGLARHFGHVVATDASEEQIRHATPVANVTYVVASAEACALAPATVSLTTVGQALHWLDHDRFYDEVRRVTVPGGVIAAWSYGACSAGADVESLLREFEDGTVGPYWNPQRRWVDEGYRTIPFPFEELPAPPFELRVAWSLSQLGEYLRSWSAVIVYRRQHGRDPVGPFLQQITKYWGPPDRVRDVTWPLAVRIGRVG